MIYDANTIRWPVGALVIHDADAKRPDMLMRVIGYTADGLCRTQYIDRGNGKTVWENDIKYLHAPHRFRIQTPSQEAP